MVYGSDDLQPLLDEFGVPVTVGAVTANGILDNVDEALLQEQGLAHLLGKITVLRVVTGTFALTSGGAITVDSVAMKIHSFLRIGDGGYTRVTCVALT